MQKNTPTKVGVDVKSLFVAVVGKFGNAVDECARVNGGQGSGGSPIENTFSLIAAGKGAEILFAVCGDGFFF